MIIVNRTDFTVIQIEDGREMRKNVSKNKNHSFWIPIKSKFYGVCSFTHTLNFCGFLV